REVLDGSRAARGHERHAADLANSRQLLDVVSASHAVAAHAVENDLTRTALLDFLDPLQHVPPRFAGATRIARELISAVGGGAVALSRQPAVDTNDDALRTEAGAQCVDERRIGERRGVDGYLFGAGIEDFLSVGDRADAAGHTERDIENSRY